MTYTKTNPERILYEGLVKSWRSFRLGGIPYIINCSEEFHRYYL